MPPLNTIPIKMSTPHLVFQVRGKEAARALPHKTLLSGSLSMPSCNKPNAEDPTGHS